MEKSRNGEIRNQEMISISHEVVEIRNDQHQGIMKHKHKIL